MAKAFESWRDAASEEDKRFCIQQLRLPYKFKNLDGLLDVNPYLSLLIYESRLEKSEALHSPNGLKEKLLEDLKNAELPSKAVVLKVDECLTTEDVEPAEQCGPEEIGSRCLLGLFFSSPDHDEQARVNVVCKSDMNSRNVELVNEAADRLAEELGLDDCDSTNSTLLFFAAPFQPAAATLIYELRNRVQNERETIWTGEVGDRLATANCYGNHRGNEQVLVALRISGPSVESWTEYIDLRLLRSEVDRKLRDLQGRLVLKRRCVALLTAPCESAYGSSKEVMSSVKRIFPGVPFVGLFDNHEFTVSASRTHLRICKKDILVSNCSPSDAPKLGIDKYMYMSVIVITYD